MKTNHLNTEPFESAYALLIRSEKEERSFTETAVYVLLILSMVISIWQVAQMRVVIPENLTPRNLAQSTAVQVDRA